MIQLQQGLGRGFAGLDDAHQRLEEMGLVLAGRRQPVTGLETSLRDLQHLGGVMPQRPARSEEHTSELQSLMRSSYAVFCLKTKKKYKKNRIKNYHKSST